MKQCYSCGLQIEMEGKPGRTAICERCSAYLHCCLNCRFYDPHAHQQCREPQADWVQDKEKGNFCGYFEWVDGGQPVSQNRADEARKKLEELFKKK